MLEIVSVGDWFEMMTVSPKFLQHNKYISKILKTNP